MITQVRMSHMNRKLRKNYYFSVEGETEKWYLKWLENQINNNEIHCLS